MEKCLPPFFLLLSRGPLPALPPMASPMPERYLCPITTEVMQDPGEGCAWTKGRASLTAPIATHQLILIHCWLVKYTAILFF